MGFCAMKNCSCLARLLHNDLSVGTKTIIGHRVDEKAPLVLSQLKRVEENFELPDQKTTGADGAGREVILEV